MTSQLIIFRAIFRPPTLILKKNSRKSTNKKFWPYLKLVASYIYTTSHRIGGNRKRYQQLPNADQKSIETVLSIAICRQCGDKWQSKTLFLTIFDLCSSIVLAFSIAAYPMWTYTVISCFTCSTKWIRPSCGTGALEAGHNTSNSFHIYTFSAIQTRTCKTVINSEHNTKMKCSITFRV